MEVEIGPTGEAGSDIFFFYVCTIDYLSQELDLEGARFGRNLIIMKEFSWSGAVAALEKLVSSFEGPDWRTLATKIGRYGLWEFEDYQDGNNHANGLI
jgi:hypothetical protein